MSAVDRSRVSVLGVVALALFVALVARLASLQVAGQDEALAQAESNRIRVVHEPAPRGQILDAGGRVIVGNREARQVAIDRQALDEAVEYDDEARDEVLTDLASVLSTSAEPVSLATIKTALETNVVDELAPVPILDDVEEDLAVRLLERHREFPGIDVDRITVREYPYDVLAAHVLGYVQGVTAEDLVRLEDEGKEYFPNDVIGKVGVERAYEDVLRGEPGQRVYEVDADNRIVREVVEESYPPTPGYDVQLTLDINLQYAVEVALSSQIEAVSQNNEGAAVVLDPETGAVLAMASYPTFKPADFINGISTQQYAALTGPESGFPLNNKVIQGNYSPGSTFKPVTALVGLRNNLVTPAEVYVDTGVYEVEGCEGDSSSCRFQNAGADAKGPVNMTQSLTVSSDAYYYRIGDLSWARRGQIGESPIQDTAREFGFDALTEIDLPFENGGIVYDPELRAQVFEDYPDLYLTGEWRTGDSVNMAIGQGDLQVTPLQLANAYAALLDDGRLRRPHVGSMVIEQPAGRGNAIIRQEIDPEIMREIDIPVAWRGSILDGLMGVTQSGVGGTAGEAFEEFPFSTFPTGGKTGTVEREGEADSAVYVGFGPVFPDRTPGYVMSVFIPAANAFGGDVAAPVVRNVFEQLAAPQGLAAAPVVRTDPALLP
jgi:penicillin-binding protein 2